LRINKVAATTLLTVMAAGTIVATTATSAGAFAFGTETAAPNKNLVNGQAVSVKVSGFTNDPDGTTLYVAQCSPLIVTQQDPTDCDQDPSAVKNPTTTGGSASATFHVLVGSSFHPTKSGLKCDFQNPCDIVVTDGQTLDTTKYAAFAQVTFKDTRAKTKTTVKGKTKVNAKKSVKFTATTTHSGTGALSGEVLFKDGKHVFGKVAETASGKVSATDKKLKAGKHHITVTYSGNAAFQSSVGKAKVTVKKKK
jgi:hypothetical protein